VRLFTAIDIPKALHPNIAALRDTSLSGARWTNPHQWHITLHFIGETQHDAAIESALQSVQIADFTFRLCGVGTFPEKGKPRVLWMLRWGKRCVLPGSSQKPAPITRT